MKIKDPIGLGFITGIVASIPQIIVDFILVQVGISKYYFFQISGGIYLNKNITDSLAGIIFGTITWLITSAILATAIVYLIKFTGKDFWWLKGIAITDGLMFTAIYGLMFTLGAAKVVPFDIPTNYAMLINNTILGFLISYLVVKWGKIE